MAKDDTEVKRQYFSIVITCGFEGQLEKVRKGLSLLSSGSSKFLESQYAYILHDKDVDDNGEVKTPHFHLCLHTVQQRRKKSVITMLANFLNMPDECISVDFSKNWQQCLRYLVHLDDKEKYQYQWKDIECSKGYEDFVISVLNLDDVKPISFQEFIQEFQRYHSLVDLISHIGVKNWNRYRTVARDLMTMTHYKWSPFEGGRYGK